MCKASILSIIKASIPAIMIVSLSAPAFADDAALKKQVDQLNSAYIESFNKQDAAGVAAFFANGAIIVAPSSGARTDIEQYFKDMFKAGIYRGESTVDQISPLGADTALGTGKYRINNQIEMAGLWTATYVREGGQWKFRMLSAIPQQQPPAK
jgi:ketosteroid isomerase-like protein